MKRRILQVFVAISLLLCLAWAGLWAWSYKHGISYHRQRDSEYVTKDGNGQLNDNVHLEISFGSGSALFYYYDDPDLELESISRVDHWSKHFDAFDDPYPPGPWSLTRREWNPKWGFGLSTQWQPKSTRWIALKAPLWLFVVLFAIPPGCWLRKSLRRHETGRCRECGYDLRATPERCPECGTASAD
jgi:hypothetical protein